MAYFIDNEQEAYYTTNPNDELKKGQFFAYSRRCLCDQLVDGKIVLVLFQLAAFKCCVVLVPEPIWKAGVSSHQLGKG